MVAQPLAVGSVAGGVEQFQCLRAVRRGGVGPGCAGRVRRSGRCAAWPGCRAGSRGIRRPHTSGRRRRCLIRPHAGAGSGCGAGVRFRCHETPRLDRRGRRGRWRSGPASPGRARQRSRAARSHTGVLTGRRAGRRSCPSSSRPWPRPGPKSTRRRAPGRGLRVLRFDQLTGDQPRRRDRQRQLHPPSRIVRADPQRVAQQHGRVLRTQSHRPVVRSQPARSGASCSTSMRLLVTLEFAQPIQHCGAGQLRAAHAFDNTLSEEEMLVLRTENPHKYIGIRIHGREVAARVRRPRERRTCAADRRA